MENRNQNIGIISLLGLKGIGSGFIRKYITPNSFSDNPLFEIKQALLKGNKRFNDDELESAIIKANETVLNCRELDIEIMNSFEESYPKNLLALKDCPSILYLKGNLNLLNKITVGIIGTRKPNSNGMKIAEKIASHYIAKNWNICNGLAEGIDKASLLNNGEYYSQVIGVVAGGLNFKNKKTMLQATLHNAEKILEVGGLIVSEEAIDKKEDTFTVVKSCRIQAGLSNGLILIQSSIDGGSKFTLKSFAELTRPLAVVNPIAQDINDLAYEANKLLIENEMLGLERITELKPEKIKLRGITVFNSKLDYDSFDLRVDSNTGVDIGQSSLFS